MQARVPELESKLEELKTSADTLEAERPGYVDSEHAHPVLADKLAKAQEGLAQYVVAPLVVVSVPVFVRRPSCFVAVSFSLSSFLLVFLCLFSLVAWFWFWF
jgi:hypothetical protein